MCCSYFLSGIKPECFGIFMTGDVLSMSSLIGIMLEIIPEASLMLSNFVVLDVLVYLAPVLYRYPI